MVGNNLITERNIIFLRTANEIIKTIKLKVMAEYFDYCFSSFFAVGNNYCSLEQFLFHPHDRGEWLGLYNSQF